MEKRTPPSLAEGISDAIGFVGGALAGFWLGQWLGMDIFAPGYGNKSLVGIVLVGLGGGNKGGTENSAESYGKYGVFHGSLGVVEGLLINGLWISYTIFVLQGVCRFLPQAAISERARYLQACVMALWYWRG